MKRADCLNLSEPIRTAADIADSALYELKSKKKKRNMERIMIQTEETMLRLSLIVKDEIERRNQKASGGQRKPRALRILEGVQVDRPRYRHHHR